MEQEQEVNPKTLMLLNIILCSDFLVNFEDELKDTKAYKQKIRHHANGLFDELNKLLNSNLKTMFDVDEEIYQNISRNLDEYLNTTSKNLINMTPSDFLEVNQITQEFLKDRDSFRNKFEITLRKLDD
jgi:hypothetical protein